MRGIFITRRIKELDSKGKEVFTQQTFRCRVNAAVPFDHKMVKYERAL